MLSLYLYHTHPVHPSPSSLPLSLSVCLNWICPCPSLFVSVCPSPSLLLSFLSTRFTGALSLPFLLYVCVCVGGGGGGAEREGGGGRGTYVLRKVLILQIVSIKSSPTYKRRTARWPFIPTTHNNPWDHSTTHNGPMGPFYHPQRPHGTILPPTTTHVTILPPTRPHGTTLPPAASPGLLHKSKNKTTYTN